MGTNLGLYGLKLGSSILTRRGDHDATTPEGPRPLDLLKLDLRFFGFCFDFWSPKNENISKLGPGLALDDDDDDHPGYPIPPIPSHPGKKTRREAQDPHLDQKWASGPDK